MVSVALFSVEMNSWLPFSLKRFVKYFKNVIKSQRWPWLQCRKYSRYSAVSDKTAPGSCHHEEATAETSSGAPAFLPKHRAATTAKVFFKP